MSRAQKPSADLVLTNIGELLTLAGNSSKPVGFPDFNSLGVLRTSNLCVAISGEKIAFVGNRSDFSDRILATSATEIDCRSQLVMPGFVDSHTHAIFAGSRENELSAKW